MVALACCASGDTLSWEFKTGWRKGFVITADTKEETIAFYDREKEKKWSQPMNNPANSVAFIENLMRRIPTESVGRAKDDGPQNIVVLQKGKERLVRRIFDVGPPGAIFRNKDYPVERELAEAERFKKEVDGFLLLSQLQALRKLYFNEPENLWWAQQPKPNKSE